MEGEITCACGKHGKDFSDFFKNATPEEKKKLMEKVIKEANQDQRNFMNPTPHNLEGEKIELVSVRCKECQQESILGVN